MVSSHRLMWEARIYRDPCRWVCNTRSRLQQPSERAMRITRAAAGRSRSRRPPVRRQFCPCQCRRFSPPSGPRQLSALQRAGTAQSPGQATSRRRRRRRLHGACRCQCNTSSAPADVSKKYAKVMEVDFQRDPWLLGGALSDVLLKGSSVFTMSFFPKRAKGNYACWLHGNWAGFGRLCCFCTRSPE